MGDNKHRDHAINSVPESEKRNWKKMLFIWLGWVFATSNLMAGGIAGSGLPLKQALLAIFIGSFILAIVGTLQSVTAARTGLSTYVLCRYSFGYKGSDIISAVFSLIFVAWFGVGCNMAAEAAHAIIPINVRILALIFSCLMLTTALFGIKGLEFLSRISVPFVIVVCIWGLFIVLRDTNFAELAAKEPAEPMTFASVTVAVIGAWISGAIVSPDIARYAKSEKDAVISAGLAFVIGNSILMWVGAIFAIAVGEWNLIKVFTGLGLGVVAFVFLIAVQWTTSDKDLYSASLGLANVLKKDDKFKITLALGGVGVLLATAGIYEYFISYLSFLGVLLPPVAGVSIVDAYFFREKYNKAPDTITVKYSTPAFISWGVGILVGIIVDFGSSAINALIISGIVYFILNKFMLQKTE
ncbi:MAG: cytosine permease [Lachnospirales bacterium]